MVTRRLFLTAAATAAAASLGPVNRALAAASAPSPTPNPSPGPTKPSKLARELAQSLQRELTKARLSDAMTEKIASDIQGNFSITSELSTHSDPNLPPPDFVFTALGSSRP